MFVLCRETSSRLTRLLDGVRSGSNKLFACLRRPVQYKHSCGLHQPASAPVTCLKTDGRQNSNSSCVSSSLRPYRFCLSSREEDHTRSIVSRLADKYLRHSLPAAGLLGNNQTITSTPRLLDSKYLVVYPPQYARGGFQGKHRQVTRLPHPGP